MSRCPWLVTYDVNVFGCAFFTAWVCNRGLPNGCRASSVRVCDRAARTSGRLWYRCTQSLNVGVYRWSYILVQALRSPSVTGSLAPSVALVFHLVRLLLVEPWGIVSDVPHFSNLIWPPTRARSV